MIYILTGGPATGKGTRSDILAEALNIPHISTGDILREVAKTDKEISQRLEQGKLISDEVVTRLLEERIIKEDCKEGFILDGYPRTYTQALLLDGLLEKHNRKITRVIELVVSDDLAFRRILERKKCEQCGKVYGIDFPPKTENVCDECGGHLSVRTDDTKETLAKRIETYKKNTESILDFYRKKGILLTVDASSHPEDIIEEAKI